MGGRPKRYHEERKQTAIRIPISLLERLREEADARDTSVNHLLIRAATAYLERGLPDLVVPVEGCPSSLTVQIERALLARHPVTLHPQRARNYAELAAFVVNGGS